VLIKIFKGSSKGSSKYYVFPLFKTRADEEFFFLLNEYRIPICYLYKNATCNAEEKIELEIWCHSLSSTVSHSFLEPDDALPLFCSQISKPCEIIGEL
jgi:hypothetical protein